MSESHDDLDACWNDYAVAIAPPPDAAARIRARVQSAVVRHDRVVETADEPAPQPVTRAAAAVLWMKSSALSVGIAVAALGGLHLAARTITPPLAELPAIVAAPEPTSRLEMPPPPPAAAIPAAPAASTAPLPIESSSPVESIAPTERPAIARPRASAPAPTSTSTTDTLAQETALLSRAKSAMDRKAYRDALVQLDEHARRFPTGMLAPERDAHRSIARCRSGERDSTIIATFTAAHPRSAYLSRVREACGDSSTDSPTPSE